MADDSTKFTLRFGGEENDINATTYGLILINAVALLEEANKELQTGAHLEIKVKSERKGSYLVDLGIQSAAMIATVAPLITTENIETVKSVASKVISTATSGLELWKKLKGEKPKEMIDKGNTYVFVTGDNNKLEVDSSVKHLVFDNKRGQEAIANTFSALTKDANVEDFTVLDEKKETLFIAEKKDFAELSKKVDIIQPEKQTSSETTQLNITRQSFEPNKKSDFLYKGFQISAFITDKEFWKSVDKGERFGKGDVLFADLEIEQEFNKAFNTYENKGYTVTKVIQHIPRQEQPTLFDS
ncbi:MAG: hypothetical protein M3033_13325 [Acidobacteriota bacterium]|nr:hypothetical protein [Acidobacteriota bacterium]